MIFLSLTFIQVNNCLFNFKTNTKAGSCDLTIPDTFARKHNENKWLRRVFRSDRRRYIYHDLFTKLNSSFVSRQEFRLLEPTTDIGYIVIDHVLNFFII